MSKTPKLPRGFFDGVQWLTIQGFDAFDIAEVLGAVLECPTISARTVHYGRQVLAGNRAPGTIDGPTGCTPLARRSPLRGNHPSKPPAVSVPRNEDGDIAVHPLLSTEQLAHELGVHINTLLVWRRRGVGPNWFRGQGRILYDSDDVAVWVAEQREARTA